MSAALFFALTAFLSAPDAGIWLPTSGRAGERAIQGLGAGGDASLYAAGGGVVYRLEPGAEWTRIGRFAPRLTWERSGEVVAHGNLPTWLLRKVESDAEQAIELPDDPEGRDALPRETLRDLLREFVEEQAFVARSPYHVDAVAPAPHGVWIATGAGLFRATKDGVTGPRADIRGPIHSVLHRKDETLVGTDDGLWRIPPEAPAVLLRAGQVTSLTESEGTVYFLSDGRIFGGASAEAAHPIEAPAASPAAVAADAAGLYLSTRLAVYRRTAGKWTLCAAVPNAPTRLITSEGVLSGVAEDTVYLFSEQCEQVSSAGPPWPGGFVFTDVSRLGGLVWASSNQGVFILSPLDSDTSISVQMEGYRRAVADIPPMDVLVLRSLEVHRLDADAVEVGMRPAWAQLLPELTARMNWTPRRVETLDVQTRMTEIEVTKPLAAWTVMAYWRMNFDRFLGFSAVSPLEYLEANGLDDEASELADGDGIEEIQDLETSEIVFDDEALAMSDSSVTDDLEGVGASLMASDRKRTSADRAKVVTQVRRLYQQRQNLLYRLWVQRSKDLLQRTTLLLSVEELDARLSAMTGLKIRSTGVASKGENER